MCAARAQHTRPSRGTRTCSARERASCSARSSRARRASSISRFLISIARFCWASRLAFSFELGVALAALPLLCLPHRALTCSGARPRGAGTRPAAPGCATGDVAFSETPIDLHQLLEELQAHDGEGANERAPRRRAPAPRTPPAGSRWSAVRPRRAPRRSSCSRQEPRHQDPLAVPGRLADQPAPELERVRHARERPVAVRRDPAQGVGPVVPVLPEEEGPRLAPTSGVSSLTMSWVTSDRSRPPCMWPREAGQVGLQPVLLLVGRVVSRRLSIIWLRLSLSSATSPCASTVICWLRSPWVTAVETSAIARSCVVSVPPAG